MTFEAWLDCRDMLRQRRDAGLAYLETHKDCDKEGRILELTGILCDILVIAAGKVALADWQGEFEKGGIGSMNRLDLRVEDIDYPRVLRSTDYYEGTRRHLNRWMSIVKTQFGTTTFGD